MKGGRRRRVNLVEAAVEIAGGVTAVARQLGVSRQVVYDWIAAGHMMNATHRYVVGLSKLSGVPIEQLSREKDQSGSAD
jgi:DNA-binding transcriptional regulator YdaS (Cro superfamily)